MSFSKLSPVLRFMPLMLVHVAQVHATHTHPVPQSPHLQKRGGRGLGPLPSPILAPHVTPSDRTARPGSCLVSFL